ncbi:MAG: taurine dioxygenase [Candidatus Hydrogenedens sp.]|nr:taurine dioxygenase [Candidatus Hydrogenedens sp.]
MPKQTVETAPIELKTIEAKPITAAMGAEISGVDLSKPLSEKQAAEIKQALQTFLVLTFKDQDLTPERHVNLAKYFGSPEVHPIVQGMEGYPEIIKVIKNPGETTQFGDSWHSDNSFFESPTTATILHAQEVPPVGGDTLFSNMYLAYDHLSEGMQKLIDPLVAIHSASDAYNPVKLAHKYRGEAAMKYNYSDVVEQQVEHPMVCTHPETGRKFLYVNRMFTVTIKGMTPKESKPLLDFLTEHALQPEFQCRIRWSDKAVTMWENRTTMHYAMNDYYQYRRIMHRITVNDGIRPSA